MEYDISSCNIVTKTASVADVNVPFNFLEQRKALESVEICRNAVSTLQFVFTNL